MQRWKVVFTGDCGSIPCGFVLVVYTSGKEPDDAGILEWLEIEGVGEGLTPEAIVGKYKVQKNIPFNSGVSDE